MSFNPRLVNVRRSPRVLEVRATPRQVTNRNHLPQERNSLAQPTSSPRPSIFGGRRGNYSNGR